MPEPSSDSAIILKDCTVLGASGFPFGVGELIQISFYENSVNCRGGEQIARFSLVELAELSVSGPGTVVTGGGFIGGGFGIDGALEGMLIAGVLNKLTTKKQTHTFISLTTNFGELHLFYELMDPGPLRIYLTDVFVKLRNLNSPWILAREHLIETQLAKGVITSAEAEEMKRRLGLRPVWPDLRAASESQRLLDEKAFNDAPKGICPSCDKVIPLISESCPHCRANFGQYASWKVLPIG